MPYITVRSINPGLNPVTGQPTPGHAWIEISGSNASTNGQPESFGYYPESNPIMGPGEVRVTDAEIYAGLGNTSQQFGISEAQAQAIRDYATQVNNGIYAAIPIALPGFVVPNYYNCAAFVSGSMWIAGVEAILPFRNIVPWWITYQYDLGGEVWEAVVALNPELNDFFTAAQSAVMPKFDPLVLDLDGDGIETVGIDTGNPIYFDQDGASQSGELFTLESLGIVSLGVAATAHAQALANGNRIGKLGSYLKADGTLGQSADVDLAEDTFHSRFTAGIPITEAVQGLPDMQGSGQVRSLRESRRWRGGGWRGRETMNDGLWRRAA